MTYQVDTLAADSRERAVTALLKYPPLRRLWGAQLVGGIGDALSVLVLVLLGMQAAALAGNFGGGYRGVGVAVAAVFGVRLLATLLFGAVLLGPLSSLTGAEGPLDRRLAMVGADVVRAALLLVAPLWVTWTPQKALGWLLVTAFVCGVAERLWTVAKDSAAPGLLPVPPAEGTAARPLPDRPQPVEFARGGGAPIHALRRLSLRTTYVSLPIAAAGLVAVTLISNLLGSGIDWFHDHQAALAAYLAAGLFAASLSILYFVEFPRGGATRARSPLEGLRRPKVNGTPDKGRTGAVPTLVITAAAVAGAIAASVAIAVLQAYDLGGGPVAFGLLVLALTGGPVIGVRTAGRMLPALSRRRLLALATAVAGVALLAVGLVPDPATGLLLALLAGIAAGAAAATGHDLLDQETEETRRPRLTGHLHAVVRLTLGAVAIVAPLLAAAIGQHRAVSGDFVFAHGGAAFAFMLIGALLLPVAALVLARIDDRQGVPLRQDLRDALRRGTEPEQAPSATGFFIAVEGGDGAGKTTQTEALAEWIRSKGHDVVVTREPGATSIGQRLRSILLDVSSAGISHRAEALLYAADRAEHVDSVIRPALERGAVVITDRYIDSSVAYQGAGRDLSPTEVARTSRWATGGLVPHLTVLLDIAPDAARERFTEAPDRLESEPAEFHQRVRSGFLALAAADPARYLVVDAAQDAEGITTVVRHRLDQLLPLSETEIRAQEEARRRAEEERKRREAEEAARKAEEERLERERQEQLARLRAEEEERMRREIEEARRREAEREAELARQRAEEARRLAEEERKRREAEEAAYRAEQERLRRLAEEQARLRAEAEERRKEKQRRAEEALLRAEQARREAEGARLASGTGAGAGASGPAVSGPAAPGSGGAASASDAVASGPDAAASGPDAETTQPLPQARHGEVGFDAAAEGEPSDARPSTPEPSDAPASDAPPSDAPPPGARSSRARSSEAQSSDAEPSDGASSEATPNAATTQRLPQVPDPNADPARAAGPAQTADSAQAANPAQAADPAPAPNPDPDAQETRVIPQVAPDQDAQETRVLPQVPDPDAQETRALPQIPDPDAQETQEMPQGSAARRRERPSWAEETPLDDLPSLADELLGPHEGEDDSHRRRR